MADPNMAIHKLDPEGDIVLALYNPNESFAVWKEGESDSKSLESVPTTDLGPEHKPSTLSDFDDEPTMSSSNHAEPGVEQEGVGPIPTANIGGINSQERSPELEPSVPQFWLSSRHLVLASEYFKCHLRGPWEQGILVLSDGRRCIEAESWDEEALLILMRIIHCRNNDVPRTVTLEMLAKIAVLVDYYQCHEVVTIWSDVWIKKLKNSLPTTCNRNLILWVLVSSVFEQKDLFQEATKAALEHCRGKFPLLDLPIADVADKIDARKQELVHRIFAHLYSVLERLRDGTAGCSFECSSMMLGALTMQMHSQGILDPRPEPPYLEYSVKSTMEMIRNFESPSWSDSYSSYSTHPCQLSELFDQIMSDTVEGLKLTGY